MTEKKGGWWGGRERGWRNSVGRREREKSKKKSSWKSKKADTGMHFKKNKPRSAEIRRVSVSVYHGGIDEYNKTL